MSKDAFLIGVIKRQLRFCLKYCCYRCGVFTKSCETAQEVSSVLQNVLSEKKYQRKIQRTLFRKHEAIIMFKNGSNLHIISNPLNGKGMRINGAIIDLSIDSEVIQHVIMPCYSYRFRHYPAFIEKIAKVSHINLPRRIKHDNIDNRIDMITM